MQPMSSGYLETRLGLIPTFEPTLFLYGQPVGIRRARHRRSPMKRCYSTHPLELRSQTTDESCKPIFACGRISRPSTRLQVVALYRLARKYLSKDLQGLPPRNESACFAALAVLLLCAAMDVDRLTGQEKEGSPEIQPFSDTTSGSEDDDLFAAASSVDRSSSSNGQLIHFGEISSTVRPSLLADYGRGSLAFEINQGQTDSSVKFLSRGTGYSLFLTTDEAVVALRRATVDARSRTAESSTPNATPDAQSFAVMRMRFVGANPAPRIEGSRQLSSRTNYLIGNDPKRWRSGVPNYARVRYQDVYPGVSVDYYGTQGQLEYDLTVDPGVDPKVIELDCKGADKLKIDGQGNLRLLVAGGEVLLNKPQIYQMAADNPARRRNIAGRYALKAGGHVGFQVGEYDRNLPLIVDPVLSYSTYLGGNGYDAGTAIVVDASGDAYVTGFTRSPNFPHTAGSFQTICGTSGTCNGYFTDAFVTKLTANGQVIYSTFLGGSGNDMGKAIVVDASGSAYVAGQTFSSDFPTTAGAFNRSYRGAGDIFVAKVNPGGTSLQYSTYLGGSGTDNAEGIAVDSAGNAYLTGQTYSTAFPTVAAIQDL